MSSKRYHHPRRGKRELDPYLKGALLMSPRSHQVMSRTRYIHIQMYSKPQLSAYQTLAWERRSAPSSQSGQIGRIK